MDCLLFCKRESDEESGKNGDVACFYIFGNVVTSID